MKIITNDENVHALNTIKLFSIDLMCYFILYNTKN